MSNYYDQAQALFEYSRKLRRDFHRHPELGFQEHRTSEIIAQELTQMGIEVTTGVAQTGVVGLIDTGKPGPVVLARFDMDALPITEENDVEYCSQNPGVMHACGHDGHMAIGLTVARMLQDRKDELQGVVKLVFQPAEEGLGGAESMVIAGVLKDPRPDYALGMHLWNVLPLGELGISSGPIMAGAEMFTIRVIGKGGHGAQPHVTRDPVLAAAQMTVALQSIVSRNVNPMDPAVVSVTSIRGGEVFNVIPPEVELRGTIRTFDPDVRKLVIDRVDQITYQVAEAMGCESESQIVKYTPAVINTPEVTLRIQAIAQEVLPEATIHTDERTMGAEDMAFLMLDIPGCFFFVGSNNKAKGLDYGHHHPRFDFDEQALPRGAAIMTASIVDLLAG